MSNSYDDSFFSNFDTWSREDQANMLDNIPRSNADQLISDYRKWKESQRNRPSAPTQASTPQQTQQGGGSGALTGAIGGEVAKEVVSGGATLPTSITGSGGALEALEIGSGLKEGPLTAGQANLAGLADGAGIAAAAYNGIDALGNIMKGSRRGKGTVEGIGTLGGTIGGAIFGGPIGAGVGSIVGRTAGRGIASLAESFGAFQPSGDEIMQGRIDDLADQGVNVANAEQRVADYGLSKDQLIEREKANEEAGRWGNSAFAQSRDESDLQSEDIWGGLPMYEIYGNEWDAMTPRERWEASRAMLDDGLVRESRGQLWIDDKDAARAAGDAAIAGERELSMQYEDGWYANNVDTLEEAAPQEGSEEIPVQQRGGGNGPMRRPRPKPMNEIPEFEEEVAPPLIQEPPPQPELKTPQDYAAAYVDVFQTNQGLPANPQLSGRY